MGLRERTKQKKNEEELYKASLITTTTTTTSPKKSTITTRTTLTIHFNDLPPWARDNSYITTHYRPITHSLKPTLHSLFYLHNESINIYSHLLGFLLFLFIIPIHLYLTRYNNNNNDNNNHNPYPLDLLILIPFLIGTSLCLLFSTTFHLLNSHSHSFSTSFNKLDHLGIVFMISGSYVPSLYYSFTPCHTYLFTFYTCLVLILGFTCITLSLHPHFRTPTFRPLRAAMYVLYGVSGFVPITHGMMIYGLHDLWRKVSLEFMLLQGWLYVLGAGIYAARVPERWWPGRFDLIGASHQIFHFLVLAAAGSHLVGLVKAFDYRHGGGGIGGGGGGNNDLRLICEMFE